MSDQAQVSGHKNRGFNLWTHALLMTISFSLTTATHSSTVYPIDTDVTLNGARVIYHTSRLDIGGSSTTLHLQNADSRTVLCRAEFNSQIEQPKRFQRIIPPGEENSITHTTRREVNRLKIKLSCYPEKTKDKSPDQ